MLKLLVRYGYRNQIHTDEPELFYKLYKWTGGLFALISLRRIIGAIIFFVVGITWSIFIKPTIYGLVSINMATFILLLEIRELKKQAKINKLGMKTPAQIRAIRIENLIRRYISTNGEALGKKEWKTIRNHDIQLYNKLLCEACNHCCYFYSLEIAKIITDSILIWGAVEEPFEKGNNYYAHAVILRNGYIYDSNMRQSIKYEDFVKLYKFKIYNQWNYDEYSKENFREGERAEFREWCKENHVLVYERF